MLLIVTTQELDDDCVVDNNDDDGRLTSASNKLLTVAGLDDRSNDRTLVISDRSNMLG